jgi:hypothetical protein
MKNPGWTAGRRRRRPTTTYGTTNLFAALNVETGEVFGECRPTRTGQDFLDFLNKAVQLHCRQGDPCRAGQPVHAHDAGGSGLAGEEPARHVSLHAGRVAWLNQVEIWSGVITRQAIRRGTFTSVRTSSGK